MALHVSTTPGEQLHYRHYLVFRYMGIKNGTLEVKQ